MTAGCVSQFPSDPCLALLLLLGGTDLLVLSLISY